MKGFAWHRLAVLWRSCGWSATVAASDATGLGRTRASNGGCGKTPRPPLSRPRQRGDASCRQAGGWTNPWWAFPRTRFRFHLSSGWPSIASLPFSASFAEQLFSERRSQKPGKPTFPCTVTRTPLASCAWGTCFKMAPRNAFSRWAKGAPICLFYSFAEACP